MRSDLDSALLSCSCGHTVFRELLQNSDDASAKAVEIHFDTEAFVKRSKPDGLNDEAGPSTAPEKLPDLKTSVVCRVLFCMSIP